MRCKVQSCRGWVSWPAQRTDLHARAAWAWIPDDDDQRRRRQRHDSGTGLAEQATDRIVVRRQKRRGMQGSVARSDGLAAWRTLLLNEVWDSYWREGSPVRPAASSQDVRALCRKLRLRMTPIPGPWARYSSRGEWRRVQNQTAQTLQRTSSKYSDSHIARRCCRLTPHSTARRMRRAPRRTVRLVVRGRSTRVVQMLSGYCPSVVAVAPCPLAPYC